LQAIPEADDVAPKQSRRLLGVFYKYRQHGIFVFYDQYLTLTSNGMDFAQQVALLAQFSRNSRCSCIGRKASESGPRGQYCHLLH
jgi:hypothetical protein